MGPVKPGLLVRTLTLILKNHLLEITSNFGRSLMKLRSSFFICGTLVFILHLWNFGLHSSSVELRCTRSSSGHLPFGGASRNPSAGGAGSRSSDWSSISWSPGESAGIIEDYAFGSRDRGTWSWIRPQHIWGFLVKHLIRSLFRGLIHFHWLLRVQKVLDGGS